MCNECVLNKNLREAILNRKEGEVCIKVNNGECPEAKEGKCWLNLSRKENEILNKNREEMN